MIMGLPDEDMFNVDKLIRARLALFTPGQPAALELSKNPTVLIVNDTVFAHGSLIPAHVNHGIERINAEVAAWMRRDPLPHGGFAPPPFVAMGCAPLSTSAQQVHASFRNLYRTCMPCH